MTDAAPNPHTVAKALTPAVNTVLMATALAEILREEIDGYSAEVLTEGNYTDEESGERLTEPKDAWLMSDAEFPAYYAKVEAKFRAAGHNPPPECCPALMAESSQREAEALLIELSKPFFGVTASQLLCAKNGLEKLRKFLDLLIGLCVNYPGYKKPALECAE